LAADFKTPPIPLSLLFHLGRNALPQDLPRLDWNFTLPMLENETYARGGSRVLLAADMVRVIAIDDSLEG